MATLPMLGDDLQYVAGHSKGACLVAAMGNPMTAAASDSVPVRLPAIDAPNV